MSDAASLRLFVAIELPEAWQQGLAKLQSRMKAALAREAELKAVRVRWVRPEGIHLTLKFIGEVAPERLEVIQNQLAVAVQEPPDIHLSFHRAGTFADRRGPRVIWGGVDSPQRERLFALAETIETWLAAAGVPRERRGFAPHLTLARLPEDVPPDLRTRLAEVTTAVPADDFAPFVVRQVSLMQSHLGPGGARYERLKVYPISALQA